jgi:hypothetical protein
LRRAQSNNKFGDEGERMSRLRFTREQAQAEASRRAAEFVSARFTYAGAQLRGTYPDTAVPRSRSSKHPVAWVAVFAFDPPGGAVMDGGELFVSVDLESGVVAVRG